MNLDLLLKDAKKIGITGHVRPDGDCTGSTLALYNYIVSNYPQIEADIYLENKNQEFAYLKSFDEIKLLADQEKDYDIFFVLDCASLDRIKPFAAYFEKAKKTICIDHHISNTDSFADENNIKPSASSTCEVLYDLLDEKKLNKDVAECIYTGLIHDTGLFKYPSTSPHTLNIAAKLISYAFDFTSIIDDSFYTRTFAADKALGLVLSKAELALDGKVIYSILTPEEMKEIGVTPAELGGVVEQLRLTKDVELAIFIYPGDGAKKVSLRSKKYIDVAQYASSCGGGGHIRAAGFSSFKGYKEIIDSIIDYAKERVE